MGLSTEKAPPEDAAAAAAEEEVALAEAVPLLSRGLAMEKESPALAAAAETGAEPGPARFAFFPPGAAGDSLLSIGLVEVNDEESARSAAELALGTWGAAFLLSIGLAAEKDAASVAALALGA